MEIAVHGRHLVVPAELKRIAEGKIAHLGRYLEGMDHAEVRFFEDRNHASAERVGCEVIVSGHGHLVRAKATGTDAEIALDRVVDKVAQRLSRLKERLVGRSHPHHSRRVAHAASAGAEPDAGVTGGADGDFGLVDAT